MSFSSVRAVLPFCRLLFQEEKWNLRHQIPKPKNAPYIIKNELLLMDNKVKLNEKFPIKNDINFYGQETFQNVSEK